MPHVNIYVCRVDGIVGRIRSLIRVGVRFKYPHSNSFHTSEPCWRHNALLVGNVECL